MTQTSQTRFARRQGRYGYEHCRGKVTRDSEDDDHTDAAGKPMIGRGLKTVIRVQGEHFYAIVGYQVGVLPLRRQAVVLGDNSPVVGQ